MSAINKKTSLRQQEFVAQERKFSMGIRLFRLLLFSLFLGLWELTASLGLIETFLFSSPVLVVKYLISMWTDKTLFLHTGITLFETLASFSLATLLSIGAALLLWMSPGLAKLLEPFLVLLNSLPKSALAPLLIVWLGNNLRTIVVTAVAVSIFGSILTLHTGFSQMDGDCVSLIYSLGGTRRDVLLKVLLPGSLPLIISSMKVNIGLCLVGVIIGEFLCARAGLGYLITYGSQTFAMTMVITSIVILCLMSLVLYQLISLVQRQAGRL